MATFEYTHRRQRDGGSKNHSRSWIKKRGEKRGENSIYVVLPYFSICYVYTFPRRGLTRFFSEIPFIFRRDSRRYIAPDMLTRKKETRAKVDIRECRSQSAERFHVFCLLIRPHCIDK